MVDAPRERSDDASAAASGFPEAVECHALLRPRTIALRSATAVGNAEEPMANGHLEKDRGKSRLIKVNQG
jgi:hypothetical protein